MPPYDMSLEDVALDTEKAVDLWTRNFKNKNYPGLTFQGYCSGGIYIF